MTKRERIIKLINEAVATVHYNERIAQRTEIKDILFPEGFFKPEDDKALIKKLLLERINKSIKEKAIASKGIDFGIQPGNYGCIIVGVYKIKKDGKIFTPTLVANDKDQGNTFIAVASSSNLITFILIHESSPSDLYKRMASHIQREENIFVSEDKVQIVTMDKAAVTYDVDFLVKAAQTPMVQTIPTKASDLPYEVRGDYRNSTAGQESLFKHKQFGTGKIIESQGGMTSTGIWDYIKVKFPDKIREFKKLYTKSYFR